MLTGSGETIMLFALLLTTALTATAPAPVGAGSAPPLHPSFRHYGVIDGLPSDAAYTVTQDREGYIWIGTRDGLARFDAQNFRIFRHDPADPASLAANDISTLLVDRGGRLWAGGEGNGLNLYRPQDGGFTHWRHDPRNPRSLSGDDVMGIAQAADGSMWVAVYAGGLDHLLPGAHGFAHLRHRADDAASLVSDNVTALATSRNGNVWIGTDAGLQRLDAQGNLRRIDLPGITAANSVWQLRADADGVDAATDAGLFHVGANGLAQRLGAAGAAYASLRDAQDELWVARQGALELLTRVDAARDYTPLPGVAGSLPGAVPLDLFADNEGGTWVTLVDGGVAYLPPAWRAFDAFRHVPGNQASLSADRVRALAMSSAGMLWVGGSNGMLDQLDPRSGHVQHFGGVIGLNDSSLSALAQDAQGRLWIGHQRGLRVFDHGRLRDIGNGAKRRNVVGALLVAHDGVVYFAGVGAGVSRVDPRTFALQAIAPPAHDAVAQQVHQLRETADGAIWSASLAGLARFEHGAGAFRFVPGIARGAVDAFAFASDGSLWLARSDRLQHYRLRSGSARLLEIIDAAHGWPTVDVGGLETDAHGRVFAITPRGLVVYDPATKRVLSYAGASGLGNPEFFPYSLLRDTGGTLYAGTLGGVMAIRYNALPRSDSVPQIALASLRVRRSGRVLQLDPRKPIDLRWNDRELTATAHALSFVDPQRNHYRFKLTGFDPGWVDTGARDTREFSSLPAGDYQLRMTAASADGPWSAASPPALLHIAAPPWATPWAYVAYALAAALLLMFAAWSMRRRLEQRHRYALISQRQQLAEQANIAKTRFLASMAHEIRTPMTGVLGMTELLRGTQLDARQRGFADGIHRSGALLMRQVDDALDLARIEAGKLELADAPFDPELLLREVAALERGLAEQKSLTLDVCVAANAPHPVCGDALRVQQVLLNLTHNALKFTQTGGVRLVLQREEEAIVFGISDDGPGLTQDECERLFQRFEQTEYGKRHSGSGLGLAISRELVALMGGRIGVRSKPGQGCTFRVHLPLRKCAAAPESAASRTADTAIPAMALDTATSTIRVDKSASRNGPLRLLVVEDDPVAAQVIAGLLEREGHTVTQVAQALATLTELDAAHNGFDAILLDLDLPGMDGCTLARMLRARGLRVPIIAVTAGSAGDEEQRALDAGMDAFVRKPVLAEKLHEVLDSAIHDR